MIIQVHCKHCEHLDNITHDVNTTVPNRRGTDLYDSPVLELQYANEPMTKTNFHDGPEPDEMPGEHFN